jgi:hypothetical protein
MPTIFPSGDPDMSLTDTQQTILAYYVAGAAGDLNMVGRFWPRSDVVLIVEDKMQIATRAFGSAVTRDARPAAEVFADRLIETGAFSTQAGKFGGTMHQFQPDIYRTTLEAMRAADPIILAAKDAGPDYWAGLFA